jgi:photosystem II stability/assembly factor-like uncharacterized protein
MRRKISSLALLGCLAVLLASTAQPVRATGHEWQLVGLAGSAVRTLAIDPKTESTLYAVVEGRILKSVDTGEHWEETAYAGEARLILIPPTTPSTLYVLDERGFVAKSIDSAASWTGANDGITSPLIGIALDAFEPSTLWAADYNFVLRSTNGAESWSEFARPPHGITAFASSQTRSGIFIGLYRDGPGFVGPQAARADPHEPRAEIAGGGYCPVDAAQSPIYSVATDPVRSNVFYAGYGAGICKTTDNGSTWRYLPSSVGHRIGFIDPFHPDDLYVFGASLLRSTDGGNTFAPFEPGLAEGVVVFALATDADGRLYAATSDGVYALGEAMATPTPTATPTPQTCGGDCDVSGDVSIGELVLIVSIVLDDPAAAGCAAADHDRDGSTQIDDLLAAVGNALHGCRGENSPTPTPDPAVLESGFCYESAGCFPCDVYPCAPAGMSRAFCCHLSRNGSFSWCPADAFDASTNSCSRCAAPCN